MPTTSGCSLSCGVGAECQRLGLQRRVLFGSARQFLNQWSVVVGTFLPLPGSQSALDLAVPQPLSVSTKCCLEPLPPCGEPKRPVELALGFRVRGTSLVSHHVKAVCAGHHSGQETRYFPGLGGPKHLCIVGQPFPDRRGVVVDHVVNSRRSILQCRYRSRCSVVQVNEREYAGAARH